jgi:polar amino acid transport system substrate-binding protein
MEGTPTMTTLRALLASLLAFTALAAEARTLEEIKADGKIIVATEGAFPPFNYFKGPTLVGFEIDVAEALAKKMGVRIEWRALSFDALLAGLRQDRWDMVIASFGITEERSKAVTFTNPHYCSGGVIVAKNPAIRTVADIGGKVIAVQTGTTYLTNVQKLGTVKEVKNFPKDTDARSALVTGRVDVWVTDRFVAKAALDANAASGLQMGEFVFVERIASAVKKGNTSLEAAVNKALGEILADGTYAALSKKYFGEDVRCR